MPRKPRTADRIHKRREIERVQVAEEKRAAVAYRRTWRDLADAPAAAELEAAVRESGDRAATLLVPIGATAIVASAMLGGTAEAGAKVEVSMITGRLAEPARLVIRDAPVPPRAAAWAEQHAATLVTEVDVATRQAIRDQVAQSIRAGAHVRDTAKRLRSTVGIHSRNLPPIWRQEEAMRKAGLSAAKIEKAVERATARAISYRANLIARTETVNAMHEGRRGLWDELAKRGHVEKAQIIREWMTAGDERVCKDLCAPLEGVQVRGLDTPFPGGAEPGLHPGDRCEVLMWPAEAI